MKRMHTIVRLGACALILSVLSACNDSVPHAASTPTGNTPPPEQIQGIATPSGVSVVTATNAQ